MVVVGGEHFSQRGKEEEEIRTLQKFDLIETLQVFLTAREVEDSLGRGELTQVLAWCHENKSRLRKLKSNLEFQVRQCRVDSGEVHAPTTPAAGQTAGVSGAGEGGAETGGCEARQEVPQPGVRPGAQRSGAAGHGAAGIPHHNLHTAVQRLDGPRAVGGPHHAVPG